MHLSVRCENFHILTEDLTMSARIQAGERVRAQQRVRLLHRVRHVRRSVSVRVIRMSVPAIRIHRAAVRR